MDIFLNRIYRNKYLRSKIFNYIKQINKELHYFTYNYYQIPLDIIINNNNKQLLIDKLKQHEKYNNNKNNQEYYKFYIDFGEYDITRKLVLCDKLFNWVKFDVELFQLIQTLFPDFIIYKEEYLCLIIKNLNLNLLQQLEKYYSKDCLEKIQNFKFDLNSNKSNNSNSNNSVIEMYNYLKENYSSAVNIGSIYNLAIDIISENKSNELGEFIINQFIKYEKSFINSFYFLKLFYKTITCNDFKMLKLILSVLQNNNSNDNDNDNDNDNKYLYIYGFRISKKEIKEIESIQLFKTGFTELFKTIYKYTKGYKLNSDGPIITIRNPEIAEYMLINNYPINRIHFKQSCLNDDLSNVEPFIREDIRWVIDEDPSSLTKYQYFLKKTSQLEVYCFKSGFNGDLEFLKKHMSIILNYYKISISTLLSAAKEGYNNIVEYILENYFCQHWSIIDLIKVLLYINHNNNNNNQYKQQQQLESIIRIYSNLINSGKLSIDCKSIMESSLFKDSVDLDSRKLLIGGLNKFPGLLDSLIEYVFTQHRSRSILLFMKMNFNPIIFKNKINFSNVELNTILSNYQLSNYFIEFLTINQKSTIIQKKQLTFLFKSVTDKNNYNYIFYLLDNHNNNNNNNISNNIDNDKFNNSLLDFSLKHSNKVIENYLNIIINNNNNKP